MKLTDLHPQFLTADKGFGDMKETDAFAEAFAIEFDCPGCAGTIYSHRIYAPFQGKGAGRPAWATSGTGYNDLTFSDSAQGTRSIRMLSGCCSHFNVTGGAIDFYADSGHQRYRERHMVETKDAAAATEQAQSETTGAQSETNQSQAGASKPPPARIVLTSAPTDGGYRGTGVLEYIGGKLHALFEHHDATQPNIFVPVAGDHPSFPTVQQVEAYVKERVSTAVAAFEARLVALEGKGQTAAQGAAQQVAGQPAEKAAG